MAHDKTPAGIADRTTSPITPGYELKAYPPSSPYKDWTEIHYIYADGTDLTLQVFKLENSGLSHTQQKQIAAGYGFELGPGDKVLVEP